MRVVLVFFMLFYSVLGYSQSFDVMTFNIRLDNSGDKENAWTEGNRKERLAQLLQAEKPAILGVQEALHHQVEFLETHFPSYHRVGVGRDDGERGGEYVAIFFNKKIFQLLDSGHFWLSETPEKPSKGWDGRCCNRITSWVQLQHKNHVFFVFNTHFDHEGKEAQQQSAVLILQKIKEITGKSEAEVIVMGDFNITPDNEGIITMKKELEDTYQPYKNVPKGTFTGFKLDKTPNARIDYIFISNGLKSEKFQIIDKKINGLYPSDHFPVKTRVSFKR